MIKLSFRLLKVLGEMHNLRCAWVCNLGWGSSDGCVCGCVIWGACGCVIWGGGCSDRGGGVWVVKTTCDVL